MRNAVQKNPGRSHMGWMLFGGLAMLASAGCMDAEHFDVAEQSQESHCSYSNKVILDWGAQARLALELDFDNFDPLAGTRTLAMVHTAMHDAINAVDRQYHPYAYTFRDHTADPVAAAASAAHRVLVNLFPHHAVHFDTQLAASLAEVPSGLARTRGIALGDQAGNLILQLRANDGSDAEFGYEPGNNPGDYQYVPPYEGFIFRPEWQYVTPFALDSAEQFRPGPPPALNSAQYRDDFNEVKLTGALDSSVRTAEQTAYAMFWYEDSDMGWNNITSDVVKRKKLSLHQTARLFALVNIAMADGFIAGFEAKYYYDFWRPYTAIRAADTDGNSGTEADPNWESFLETPPVQDYPSTHSVAGDTAATVLARVLGDRTTFSIASTTAEDPTELRTFRRFSTAADENGDSRVQAGIHFRFAVTAGQQQGKDIGNYTVDTLLRRY